MNPHQIIHLLEEARRGLPEAAIARQLNAPRSEIRIQLKRLVEKGEVEQRGGRFHRPLPSQSGSSSGLEASDQAPGAYDLVRRVCAFHADVVKEVESSNLEFNRADPRLTQQLHAPVDWNGLAEGKEVHFLRHNLPEQFRKSVPQGNDNRVTLCGPLHLMRERSREGVKWKWRPIFMVHARERWTQDTIGLTQEGEVDVNLAWLDRCFTDSDEGMRNAFLVQAGLLGQDVDGSFHHREVLNFSSCWAAIENIGDWLPWKWHRSLAVQLKSIDLSNGSEEGIVPVVLAMREDLSKFSKGLVHELRAISKATDAALEGTALALMIQGPSTPDPQPDQSPGVRIEASPLNSRQTQVVESSLSKRLTVVQGPPGTGKSTVVRSVLLSAGVNGQTALFSSVNHRAIDAVLDSWQNLPESDRIVADLRPNSSLGAWTEQLIAASRERPADDDFSLPEFIKEIEALNDSEDSELEKARELLGLSNRLADLYQQATELNGEIGDFSESIQAALRRLPDQDLQVLNSWESTKGRWKWIRHFITGIQAISLKRSLKVGRHQDRIHLPQYLKLESICRDTDALERTTQEFPSSEDLTEAIAFVRSRRRELTSKALPHFRTAWAKQLSGNAAIALENICKQGNRTSLRRQARAELERQSLGQLLPGLPLWAITSLSAARAVPLVAGVFDLAVIDEAGQCNPASVLPLLFRAKRALIVGDPQQLRPISRLGLRKEDMLRRKHGLASSDAVWLLFSGRSAYELAADSLARQGGGVHLLREHYRCHPEIARYFSEQFYGDQLLIRTEGRSGPQFGLSWTEVPGGSQTVGTSRWHPPQVRAIVDELKNLSERSFDGSVGVVTPFRENAKRITDLAHEEIGAGQLKKWSFISETADKFQGGEKDIVLFGLVGGGGGDRETPGFYTSDENRFNVAVSRARILLHVFGDSAWAMRSGVVSLERLAQAASRKPKTQDDDFRSDLVGPVWEPRLAAAMSAAGLEYRQQFPALGYYLDFALFSSDGRKLNIEVDGETWHRDRDGNLREEDVRRDLALKADGWTVKRFWVYSLRENMDNCVQQISSLIMNREE